MKLLDLFSGIGGFSLGAEYNNKLTMKHIPNFKYVECQTAITKLVEDFENKNPNKKIKAAKCNDPVTWFKKYKLNKWDQIKDKE